MAQSEFRLELEIRRWVLVPLLGAAVLVEALGEALGRALRRSATAWGIRARPRGHGSSCRDLGCGCRASAQID